MKTPAALAAALLTAVSAAAQDCPVAGDLAGGIHVTYDDDSVTEYRGTIGGEVVEHTVLTDGSGDAYELTTLAGLYSTSYVDGPGGTLDESTRETVTYGTDLTRYLPVSEGQQFSTTLVRRYADGSEPVEERYSVFIGKETSVELAGCVYAALPVTHTYVDDAGVYGLSQHYLPELGIGIYASYAEMGGDPTAFTVLEISRQRPM